MKSAEPDAPDPGRQPASDPPKRDAQWIRDAVVKHERSLIISAHRILMDLDRAREVVQETFLRLCAQDPERVQGHLTEWLFTVCRNRALDVQRKEKRMNPMSDQDLEAPSSPEPGPLQVLEKKESTSEVVLALTALSGNQQEVLRLKFQNGLSYKEISRVTNLTVTNVGFLIHTGLKTLRKSLARSNAPGMAQ